MKEKASLYKLDPNVRIFIPAEDEGPETQDSFCFDDGDLIKEIFEEIKDRLVYLEIHPEDTATGQLSLEDEAFNEAIIHFNDILLEVKEQFTEQYEIE